MAGKRTRNNLSLEQKCNLIDDAEKGELQNVLAVRYGIAKSSVSRIVAGGVYALSKQDHSVF